MGQAVIDLPDPLEQPPAGASADDLLSQLAGDEIDRLLGESEDKPEPAVAEEAVAGAASPLVDAAPAVAEESDTGPAGAPADEPAVPPVASGELDQAIAAHADAVLGPSPTAVEPAGESEPIATEPERDALLAIAAGAEAEDEPQSLPLVLRPLEWLSRPLEGLSPGARDFLGKAAIVTLVNSAAVIAYVIWFRH